MAGRLAFQGAFLDRQRLTVNLLRDTGRPTFDSHSPFMYNGLSAQSRLRASGHGVLAQVRVIVSWSVLINRSPSPLLLGSRARRSPPLRWSAQSSDQVEALTRSLGADGPFVS